MKHYRFVLGIETSCDETSAAVVENGKYVRSNIIASQVNLHATYGGVVPEIASRKHLETIVPVVREALSKAGIGMRDLQGVAVTCGPGLAGALLVGVAFGKALAYGLKVDFTGVNHLEGHIYANFLDQSQPPDFPLLCLVVSGGHTDLIHMTDPRHLEILGRTRDDAAGEAFDKVARLLRLGYPGGPLVDSIAQNGNPDAYRFPRAYLEEGSYDFSFSGLKTAVAHTIESGEPYEPADIAASFQKAVASVLVDKAFAALRATGAKMLLLAGGVSANSEIRRQALARGKQTGIPVRIPPAVLCTDNAAMIACAGYTKLLRGDTSPWDLNVYPNLPLGKMPEIAGGF